MNPLSIILGGGGVHGKACWLIAYMGGCLLSPPPPSSHCYSHGFNFRATLLCVEEKMLKQINDFIHNIVISDCNVKYE